ncbi:MAG: hypothetical protein AABZ06_05775 [Bdellovibrionota bacterium]
MQNQKPLSLTIQIQKLKNAELLDKLVILARDERKLLVEFLVCLREFDIRKLYLEDGYSSLFSYLTQCLNLSEGSAYRRIQAARLSLKYPLILERLEHGKLTLANLSAISPILTTDNCSTVLTECEKLTKRGVEKFVAMEQAKRMREFYSCGSGGGESGADGNGARIVSAGTGGSSVVAATMAMPPRFRDKIEFFAAPGVMSMKMADTTKDVVPNTHDTKVDQDSKFAATGGGAQDQASGAPASDAAKAHIRIKFTASAEMMDEIKEVRDILSHRLPNAQLKDIFEAALDAFLEKYSPERRIKSRIERHSKRDCIKNRPEQKSKHASERGHAEECKHARKCEISDNNTKAVSAATNDGASNKTECTDKAYLTNNAPLTTKTPTTNSRYIPQAVRDVVWQRDQGRCSYVSPGGKRCDETRFLEYHHEHAWAMGGSSIDPANITIRCKRHNWLAAVQVYGASHMNQFGRPFS